MKIGVPKEIKVHEFRVGLVPASVNELTRRGHTVLVETSAGLGIDAGDGEYRAAGAVIVESAEELFADSKLIVKVKEPQAAERKRLRPGQILFTFLHLAADAEQTADLLESEAICIAYETVSSATGGLPLLAPMSEVAGRMSIQAGAHCLEKSQGGRGVLLAGVPGVAPAKVVIVGGGVVGYNAARMAVGLGAQVVILDNNVDSLQRLDHHFGGTVQTIYSTRAALNEQMPGADLVIGSVLIPGAAAPKLVTANMVKQMKTGAAVVDVAIDQGGCFETSRATTHTDPSYIVDDVVHYCVTNIPGAVATTSSWALNNVALPYVITLADKGWQQALADDPHFLNGLNVYRGQVTNAAVAQSLGYNYLDARRAINQ